MQEILPLLIGGLVLFIYAITKFSEIMRDVFSEKAKNSIAKYTRNTFLSILVGTVATVLLDSSSAVIILTIIFINSGGLSFRQAVGIIMGANIGTTFSSQIIAMDVGKYAIVPLILGLVLELVAKKDRIKRIGNISLYFGMLFFGLYIMEESVTPLKNSSYFEELMASIENKPLKGTIIGGLTTLIIQSSSATVGMAIVLGKQKLISIAGGIAVMLGAELGTCSDTLIATIKGSRQAIRAGVFHLLFNLSTIVIGLFLFDYFVYLVEYITVSNSIDNHIANAHVVFNICGVLLFLPFVGAVTNLMERLIPDKKN